MRALLSVWDKTGLVDFARALSDAGYELVASGGTARCLAEGGVEHVDVETVTGSPEMFDGRVKTLHPRIHGAILADRDRPEHVASLAEHEITPFDLVVSNLYPFEAEPSIELIDVGGPAMVRAAAKNHAHVGVITSPDQYDEVLDEIRANGTLSRATRHRLARAAFRHTAHYDAQVVSWFDSHARDGLSSAEPTDVQFPRATAALDEVLPERLTLTLERAEITRYGENPHQVGARYRLAGTTSWWDGVEQLSGSALSYLNFFDADAAWRLVHELASDVPQSRAVAIIKHANASGAAVADSLGEAFARALAADPQSAFGGVVAVAGAIDDALAALICAGPQADVVVASDFSEGAVAALVARRRATRLLRAASPEPLGLSIRTTGNSALAQNGDELLAAPSAWRCVSDIGPTPDQLRDLVVAWRVCARTTSNAIVLAREGVAVGVGAGQQSRVVAARIAVDKAGGSAQGSAAASDAFFPFADGLHALSGAGVAAIVQPGGSVRDEEIIAAANDAGLVMMMTGERHFRH